MADLQPLGEITQLTRADISAAVNGNPRAIRAFEAIQRMALSIGPENTEAANNTAEQGVADAASAQGTADVARTEAATAQTTADGAQVTADNAQTSANTAQTRADDAYTLAEQKAGLSAGPAWAAPSGTLSRASLASYTAATISNPPTQAQVQAVANALQAVSQAMVALITDLRATGAIKP